MTDSRALVSCTVLSIQDSCFVYPFCNCCLSRLIQQTDRALCRKCGFICDPENVDYRYRLSLKVSRKQDIFGVTIFGSCLNPFFGIPAGDFQRIVWLKNPTGPYSSQQLLTKAVEDCFIGRSVVLGLKVFLKDDDNHTSSLSGQFLAYQIISPSEALVGFSVIAYFRKLLQANAFFHSSESTNNTCMSRQKDSQSSQREERFSFDHTLPSCAKLNSQSSHEESTLSSIWQTPGLCFNPEEDKNLSMHQSQKHDCNLLLLTNENLTTLKQADKDQSVKLQYIDDLKDNALDWHRKSQSSNSDMLDSSADFNQSNACDPVTLIGTVFCENTSEKPSSSSKCFVTALRKECNVSKKPSFVNEDDEFYFIDAPFSENLEDFIQIGQQKLNSNSTSEHRLSETHCERKDHSFQDKTSHFKNEVFVTNNSPLQIPHCVKKPSAKDKNQKENDCMKYLETKIYNSNMPKNPNIVPKMYSPEQEKKNSLSNSTAPYGSDNICVSTPPEIKRLCVNREAVAFKRKHLATSRLSAAFYSANHEETNRFGHCAHSEVHSVNRKVKQDMTVFEKHNCSIDLFASYQSVLDVTDITEISEPQCVNKSEPEDSVLMPFSPCLQSTPVSCCRQTPEHKLTKSQRRIKSLNPKKLKHDRKSNITDASFKTNSPQNSNFFGNVNDWSRDLFENSF